MAKRTYLAMLEPASGGYGVSFHDLPGCVSHGADLQDAARNAEEALSLHLEGLAEDGSAFPEPSHAGDLVGAMDQPPGAVWAAITVEAPDASERVNVYLPKSLIERIDRFARDHGMNRSAAIGLAASRLVGRGGVGGEAGRD